MLSLLPFSLYCISLLFLQLNALPVGNRLDFKTIFHQLREEGSAIFPDADPSSDVSTNAPAVPLDKTSLWRALLFKNPPAVGQDSASALNPSANSVERGPESNQRSPRDRRNTYPGSRRYQHGQLMRVDCILSTCQVHKLTDRLAQMMRQNGLPETAPIHPQSPHSYG